MSGLLASKGLSGWGGVGVGVGVRDWGVDGSVESCCLISPSYTEEYLLPGA